VTEFERDGEVVRAVVTDAGRIECETLVLAPGPWAARLLAMLGVDAGLEYWKAQEGEFALRGAGLSGRAGSEAPVVHLDQAGPLRSDRDGRVLVDGAWGIYFRMGRTGTGITGGGLPVLLSEPDLDPYGPDDNPAHAAEPDFEEFFTSGLATALRRFRGRSNDWQLSAAGGVVAHTPDNYPACDWVLDNTYAIVDSGHGFKTLAIGRLAADDITDGREPLLEPFRLDRFERGALHTASNGPYPWT
jgi:glycine/D-amino acid oxidase-like deaminating enzyme